MSFGVQIFNDTGKDITSGVVTEFIVDSFEVTGAGSKTYQLSSGESLRYLRTLSYVEYLSPRFNITSVSISGGTISWSGNTNSSGQVPYSERLIITKVST